MENASKPTVYERQDYNGKYNLLAGERDRILLVLNHTQRINKTAKLLRVTPKTLNDMMIRHRITMKPEIYATDNKWD